MKKIIFLIFITVSVVYGMRTHQPSRYSEHKDIFFLWEKEEVLLRTEFAFNKVKLIKICLENNNNFNEYNNCTGYSATKEALEVGYTIFKEETLEVLKPVIHISKLYKKCVIKSKNIIDITACKAKSNLMMERASKD